MHKQEGKRARKTVSKKPFTLELPSLFPSHTRPDIIMVQEWKYREGDILPPDPDRCLLTVSCCYGEGSLLIPDFLGVPHRIVKILRPAGTTMQLGDPLFVLEPVEEGHISQDSVA